MIGDIYTFAGEASALPANRLPCDGRALSRTIYADLFGVIGTLWGSGDGSTTFNIPLISDFVRASTSTRAVGSSQDSQNLSHSHSLTVNSASPSSSSDGEHVHLYPIRTGSTPNNAFYFPTYVTGAVNATFQNTLSNGSHTHIVTHSHSADCSASGNSESCPKNKAVLYCIEVFKDSSSASGGLTEEQVSMLQTVSDFVKANCKQNTDGSYDYNTFFNYQSSSGQTLYASDDWKYFSTLLHEAIDRI